MNGAFLLKKLRERLYIAVQVTPLPFTCIMHVQPNGPHYEQAVLK